MPQPCRGQRDLSLDTEKDTLNLQIYGKKRDNELARLLDNVKIGNAIEFPVWVKDKNDLKARKIQPVKTCAVLRLDELDEEFEPATEPALAASYDIDVN